MPSLKAYNTFGVEAEAPALIPIESDAQLLEQLRQYPQGPYFVLGGGSNVLFRNNPTAIVLLNRIKGKTIVEEDENEVTIAVGGGENWHDLVLWTLEHHWAGLENLSLIPGTVGAAPIQNIGAYGMELKDTFVGLEAIELSTGEEQVFSAEDCAFGYRDSYFKRAGKGRYFITRVYLTLQKQAQVNVSYGAIREVLQAGNIHTPSIQDVSRAVIHIRNSKLPDPALIGNGGSFFKNPELEVDQLNRLQEHYPQMPHYPTPSGKSKIPAGWLIEQCGWKGQRRGNAGCYEKQALVLVNLGGASGAEIWTLAQEIQESVRQRFGIELEVEVNVI
jgi:UDP-N-acetylmuramate dehydrogenase